MSMYWAARSAGGKNRVGSSDFRERVIEIIRTIPEGKVASYGQIAAAAGFPGLARQVSWILSRDSRKFNLPWQRVINSSGGISLPGEKGDLQRAFLEAEGIEFSPQGRTSLKRFGFFN